MPRGGWIRRLDDPKIVGYTETVTKRYCSTVNIRERTSKCGHPYYRGKGRTPFAKIQKKSVEVNF